MVLPMLMTNALAQNVGVKVDDVNAQDDTTIEIRKGQRPGTPLYEVTEGEATIEGDSALLLTEARKNWKNACNDWKTEFRELNKENSILAMSCGKQNCVTQTSESQCTSKGTYKLKIKVN